jgi:hypothetical protein
MSIPELISILQRRLAYLDILRKQAVPVGDLEQIDRIDAEVFEIQIAINKLQA